MPVQKKVWKLIEGIMYKQDLALNNLQCLIYHKIQENQQQKKKTTKNNKKQILHYQGR